MAIKAVIFDIGGVLLHNNSQEKERAWETEAGLPEGAIFKYINRSGLGNAATRGKISRQEVWSKVSEHFKIDLAQIQAFEANLVDSEVLNTELADFLQSLRPKYKTALLSNAWPGTREAFNPKYGLDKMVDIEIFSAEEGMLKPETMFYQVALIRLQVRGYEAVFLDDNAVNVDAASLFGIQSIQYRNNEQAIKEIKRILG